MRFTYKKNDKQYTLEFNTSLMALINYKNYFGTDCLADLELAATEKNYTNLFQCVAACYKSPTTGLGEDAIEEFLNNEHYLSNVAMNEDFIDKFTNALLGTGKHKGGKSSGKPKGQKRQK